MTAAPATERAILSVSGMTCSACVARVERGLLKSPGVHRAAVNLVAGTAVVEFDPATATTDSLAERVSRLGYESRARAEGAPPVQDPPDTTLPVALASLAVFAVSMALGAPLMHVHDAASGLLATLAMPFHGVLRAGLPGLWSVSSATLGWILLLLHIPVVAFGVRPFVVSAWKAARDGAADMNTLVAAGTLSAFLLSLPSVLLPQWLAAHGLPAPLWFESVSGVIGFVKLGKWLESRAKVRSRGSLQALAALVPAEARLLIDGEADRIVDPGSLLPGDRVRVLPGDRVPADGILDGAAALVDESHLTGEPLPREIARGEEIQAGSLAVRQALVLEVRRSGESTTIERITRLVEEAQSSKAPLQKTADRLAEVFAPLVLVASAATLVGWLLLRPDAPLMALTAAISLLVAACPCAMGLAVPSALTVALGRAASAGVLVRDAAGLENLGRATMVLFDKTGTLTEGKPRLSRILPTPGTDEGYLLALAALGERESNHPLAGALLEAASTSRPETQPKPLPRIDATTTFPGAGVECETDQGVLRIGKEAWVAPSMPSPAVARAGESLVHVSLDGVPLGALAFRDPLRPESGSVVQALRDRGIEVGLLSGDGPEAVEWVASSLGIRRAESRCTPESKAASVDTLRKAGHVVVMVGDGINDAAALAGADAGLAIGSGTAVAFECAQAVVQTPAAVVAGIDLGRATVRTIRGNLGWAFGYNILLLPVAAGLLFPFTGWLLSPVLAGAAMSLSSVSVMLHSLRLLGFRSRPLPEFAALAGERP